MQVDSPACFTGSQALPIGCMQLLWKSGCKKLLVQQEWVVGNQILCIKHIPAYRVRSDNMVCLFVCLFFSHNIIHLDQQGDLV